jgi:glycosyltransferase involved in cell wall biosynthesis
MRIAFVSDDSYPGFGGQARATEGWAEVLASFGHEVRVVTGAQADATDAPPGVSVRRVRSLRLSPQAHMALPERRVLAELLDWADIVQINTASPLALASSYMARKRQVTVVIAFLAQEENTSLQAPAFRSLIEGTLKRFYKQVYKQADALTTLTPFAARLAAGYVDCPVHIVPSGITLPIEQTDTQQRAQALRERLLGNQHYLLSYLGRLSSEKRPQDTLGILEHLGGLRDDTVLALAGHGPLLPDLRAQAQALGLAERVHFLGFIDEAEKDALLYATDVFLMPSQAELQSIATIEAMARDCVVFAADFASSAVVELIRDAEGGFGYDPADLKAAAAQIHALLEQPERLRCLKDKARAGAARYDLPKVGRELERLYEALLARKAT